MKVKLLDATNNMVDVIARASSVCYDSNLESKDRVKRIISSGHYSCLRFVSASVEIEGISRSCSHQIVRHSHLNYLQRSQRYVRETNASYITPPSINDNIHATDLYDDVINKCFESYYKLLELGIKKEDARYVLPNACHTKINIVGNIQAWRDYLYGPSSRLQKKAQWEIRYVSKEIEKILEKLLPDLFGRDRYEKNLW